MVLNKIKKAANAKGFTLVELIIVIVVIAILAAITIVAYSGITARANNSTAQGNVEATQKVAEAINADNGSYPGYYTTNCSGTTNCFASGSISTRLPAGVTLAKIVGNGPNTTTGASAAASGWFAVTTYNNAATNKAFFTANPGTTVGVSITGTQAASTGGALLYYDSTTNLLSGQSGTSATVTYYGSATASSSFSVLGT